MAGANIIELSLMPNKMHRRIVNAKKQVFLLSFSGSIELIMALIKAMHEKTNDESVKIAGKTKNIGSVIVSSETKNTKGDGKSFRRFL